MQLRVALVSILISVHVALAQFVPPPLPPDFPSPPAAPPPSTQPPNPPPPSPSTTVSSPKPTPTAVPPPDGGAPLPAPAPASNNPQIAPWIIGVVLGCCFIMAVLVITLIWVFVIRRKKLADIPGMFASAFGRQRPSAARSSAAGRDRARPDDAHALGNSSLEEARAARRVSSSTTETGSQLGYTRYDRSQPLKSVDKDRGDLRGNQASQESVELIAMTSPVPRAPVATKEAPSVKPTAAPVRISVRRPDPPALRSNPAPFSPPTRSQTQPLSPTAFAYSHVNRSARSFESRRGRKAVRPEDEDLSGESDLDDYDDELATASRGTFSSVAPIKANAGYIAPVAAAAAAVGLIAKATNKQLETPRNFSSSSTEPISVKSMASSGNLAPIAIGNANRNSIISVASSRRSKPKSDRRGKKSVRPEDENLDDDLDLDDYDSDEPFTATGIPPIPPIPASWISPAAAMPLPVSALVNKKNDGSERSQASNLNTPPIDLQEDPFHQRAATDMAPAIVAMPMSLKRASTINNRHSRIADSDKIESRRGRKSVRPEDIDLDDLSSIYDEGDDATEDDTKTAALINVPAVESAAWANTGPLVASLPQSIASPDVSLPNHMPSPSPSFAYEQQSRSVKSIESSRSKKVNRPEDDVYSGARNHANHTDAIAGKQHILEHETVRGNPASATLVGAGFAVPILSNASAKSITKGPAPMLPQETGTSHRAKRDSFKSTTSSRISAPKSDQGSKLSSLGQSLNGDDHDDMAVPSIVSHAPMPSMLSALSSAPVVLPQLQTKSPNTEASTVAHTASDPLETGVPLQRSINEPKRMSTTKRDSSGVLQEKIESRRGRKSVRPEDMDLDALSSFDDSEDDAVEHHVPVAADLPRQGDHPDEAHITFAPLVSAPVVLAGAHKPEVTATRPDPPQARAPPIIPMPSSTVSKPEIAQLPASPVKQQIHEALPGNNNPRLLSKEPSAGINGLSANKSSDEDDALWAKSASSLAGTSVTAPGAVPISSIDVVQSANRKNRPISTEKLEARRGRKSVRLEDMDLDELMDLDDDILDDSAIPKFQAKSVKVKTEAPVERFSRLSFMSNVSNTEDVREYGQLMGNSGSAVRDSVSSAKEMTLEASSVSAIGDALPATVERSPPSQRKRMSKSGSRKSSGMVAAMQSAVSRDVAQTTVLGAAADAMSQGETVKSTTSLGSKRSKKSGKGSKRVARKDVSPDAELNGSKSAMDAVSLEGDDKGRQRSRERLHAATSTSKTGSRRSRSSPYLAEWLDSQPTPNLKDPVSPARQPNIASVAVMDEVAQGVTVIENPSPTKTTQSPDIYGDIAELWKTNSAASIAGLVEPADVPEPSVPVSPTSAKNRSRTAISSRSRLPETIAEESDSVQPPLPSRIDTSFPANASDQRLDSAPMPSPPAPFNVNPLLEPKHLDYRDSLLVGGRNDYRDSVLGSGFRDSMIGRTNAIFDDSTSESD